MKNSHEDPIKSLFEPKNIAIVGASNVKGKIGYTILNNIVSGGYRGNIYPVNPKGGTIMGYSVYQNIADINETIDLVTVAVPAKFVLDTVENCAKKKAKHIQIITSGFSEIGNIEEEKKIVAIAKSNGMRILGPNIFGLYSAAASMNATFSASKIKSGHVAILTQSGALGVAMIGKTAVDNIGLSAIVSTGNKCDIDENDLLRYLVPQKETRVILMYIEGVKNGSKLIDTLKWATEKKPVIVIKSGRSKRGAMAAASHTGSLAGSDEIFDAIMKQCGVIRAKCLNEAFNWCEFFAFCPTPKGRNTVIVTNGGGVGVLATDTAEEFDIDLYDDQTVLKQAFEDSVPAFGSTKNPIDITGGANSDHYKMALNAPVNCKHIDATIALYCETSTFDSENLVPMIKDTFENHKKAGKPISYAIVGGEDVEKAMIILKKENVPVYNEVNDAVSSLGVSFQYQRYLKEKSDLVEEAEIDIERINSIIDLALKDQRPFLLSNESADIMSAAGITMPKSKIAKNINQAIQYANEIGYPVVMKVVSRDILHKSDAGGVALDLINQNEVLDAYEAIIQNSMDYNPQATIDGIEVSEMVEKGVELIVGARMDRAFGPIVMCGMGGIYVEVIKDVVFRGLPINSHEAMKMLKEIRSFPLLLGVRGEKKKDIDGVIDTIMRVGSIIKKCNKITDIEINPVVVYEQNKGLRALDVRILIKNPQEAT